MGRVSEKRVQIEPPVDRYGRKITHLRVSVTERCNLNCPYCHREGLSGSAGSEGSFEVFRKILYAASRIGISESVKFTGGEPLLRTDLELIISAAKESGFSDISLTTNGTLLDDRRSVSLKSAGLSRVNIGCDALSSSIVPKTYERIKSALDAASSAHLSPIKINMVLLKGINENDVHKMLDIARFYSATLQLIELIETEDKQFFKNYFVSLERLEKEMRESAVLREVRSLQGRAVYHLGNGATVEFVRSAHNPHFCANCRKLRITPDGRIKTCLLRNDDTIEFTDEASFLKALSIRRPYYG